MKSERGIYTKAGAQVLMDVPKKRDSFNKVSALNMPCCGKFLRWDGSGMEGLMEEAADCPLCGAALGETCAGKGPVES